MLLLSDHGLNLRPLIIYFVQVSLHVLTVFFALLGFICKVINLRGIRLESGLKEKLPVADPACSTHATVPLYLTQSQIIQTLQSVVLSCEYPELVSTFLAGFVPAKLTIVSKDSTMISTLNGQT